MKVETGDANMPIVNQKNAVLFGGRERDTSFAEYIVEEVEDAVVVEAALTGLPVRDGCT